MQAVRHTSLALAVLVFLAGCSKPEPTPAPKPPPVQEDVGSLGKPHPIPERVVAMGDLHGDLDATRRALRLAGAIDAKDAWIGGKLVVVQTGDQIDRGDEDKEILDLFEKLKDEAKKAGGEVVAMSGNHEIMNAMFDFRYVTKGSYGHFDGVPGVKEASPPSGPNALNLPPEARSRAIAFAPGGPYAKMIAKRPVVARVGDSIFVHGGVLPKHVKKGLDKINADVAAFLDGTAKEPPSAAVSEDGVVWTRAYSAAPGKEECADLASVLTSLGAKRMVMGHTPQKPGIQPTCEKRGWRIDTGMAKFYGGPIEVLEIKGDAVTVLKESGAGAPTTDAGATSDSGVSRALQ